MSIFVLLTLFGEWVWTDQSPSISTGFEWESSKVVFLDMDADGDEDLLRAGRGNTYVYLEAFENTDNEPGANPWTPNDNLAFGVDWEPDFGGEYYSLGAGDLNGDGTEEIVVVDDWDIFAYVKAGDSWVKKTTFFDDLDADFVPYHPDFADVDSDGDLDMLGGWCTGINVDYRLGLWKNTGTEHNPQWEFDSTYFMLGDDAISMTRYASWIDYNDDDIMDVIFVRWFFDADWDEVDVLINRGSGINPEWDEENVYSTTTLGDIAVLDWNADDLDDVVMVDDYMHPEGYLYVPGESAAGGLSYSFDTPYLWGGIFAYYPAAADINSDGLPELALIQEEYYWGLNGSTIEEYFLPCLKCYSFSGEPLGLWRRYGETTFWSLGPTEEHPFGGRPASLQYVDFGGDGLIDYVLNLDGENSLSRNKGTAQAPSWVRDEEAFDDLPGLFPSSFLDVDGDGDQDVIGVPEGDSVLRGFINTGSDAHPRYMQYDELVSGLEGVKVSFIAAGDVTDNGLNLPDIAVGIRDEKLTAFFNSGLSHPRWHRHDEVFKTLGEEGKPCLCDADDDGDLDLFLVRGGRLNLYINESTGGVAEEQPPVLPQVSVVYRGGEAEVSLTISDAFEDTGEVSLALYNAAGQRVMSCKQVPLSGRIRFRVAQASGVYFCRIARGNLSTVASLVLLLE